MSGLQADLRAAARIARLAAAAIARTGATGIERKLGTDIVTAADLAAEAVILEHLRREFPADGILAEESGAGSAGTSGRRWVIDPLDGTVNFANGIPYFGVSIGLEDDEGALAGCIVDVTRRETHIGARGVPARVGRVAMRPEGAPSLDAAVLALQLPHAWHEHAPLDGVVAAARGSQHSGSTALDLAWTARGRFDACLYRRTANRWDWIAGEAIIAATPDSEVRVVDDLGGLPLVAAGRRAVVDEIASRLERRKP